MTEKKYCQCCGILISDINEADYFRHIRVKYCDHCREAMKNYKNALRQYNFRQRKKQISKLRDARIQMLSEENELLRQRLTALREQAERK